MSSKCPTATYLTIAAVADARRTPTQGINILLEFKRNRMVASSAGGPVVASWQAGRTGRLKVFINQPVAPHLLPGIGLSVAEARASLAAAAAAAVVPLYREQAVSPTDRCRLCFCRCYQRASASASSDR